MLGIKVLPVLPYAALCSGIPESSRWLTVYGGQREAAAEFFRQINPGFASLDIDTLADTSTRGPK